MCPLFCTIFDFLRIEAMSVAKSGESATSISNITVKFGINFVTFAKYLVEMIFSFALYFWKQGSSCWFMRIGLQNLAKSFWYKEIFFINFNSKKACRNEFSEPAKFVLLDHFGFRSVDFSHSFVQLRYQDYSQVKIWSAE